MIHYSFNSQSFNTLARRLGIFALLLPLFTASSALCLLGIHWVLYAIAASTLYRESWIAPTLLLLAAFLGGLFNRFVMDRQRSSLYLFATALFAAILFAWLTDYDLNHGGLFYLKFLPTFSHRDLHPFALMTPTTALIGMLTYGHFFSPNK